VGVNAVNPNRERIQGLLQTEFAVSVNVGHRCDNVLHAVRQCAALISTRITLADRIRQTPSLSMAKVIHSANPHLCRESTVIHNYPQLSPVIRDYPQLSPFYPEFRPHLTNRVRG
jgi:hypothetical protein